MFTPRLFIAASFLLLPFNVIADDLEDFLKDTASSEQAILLDIEEDVGANFDVVDDLLQREKTLEESLIIPPKYKRPRSFGNPEPFTAQLKAGTILRDLKSGKGFRIEKPIVVKAQSNVIGGNVVFIFDKDGKKRYETAAPNAVNVEHVVRLTPEIDPLVTYTDTPRYGAIDRETNFSHFLSMHLETIRTDYFSTIFRGERTTANSNQFQLKSYFVKKDFPIQVGFNLAAQFGYWEDPVLGTVTWSGAFVGPSFMRSFWKNNDNQWNMHLSGFRSIIHESEKAPDRHRYSTNGLQFEVEKQMGTTYGPFTLGFSYRYSRSSIKSTTEFLQNESIKGQVVSFGVHIGYRFDWML